MASIQHFTKIPQIVSITLSNFPFSVYVTTVTKEEYSRISPRKGRILTLNHLPYYMIVFFVNKLLLLLFKT